MDDNSNQIIRFRLDLSYDQFLAVYQGIAKTILTTADDGRNVQFPAMNVQRFLDKNGVKGYFEMELTARNKFVGIKKLG